MKKTKEPILKRRWQTEPLFMLFICVAIIGLYWTAQQRCASIYRGNNFFLVKMIVCVVFLIISTVITKKCGVKKDEVGFVYWFFGWASGRFPIILIFVIMMMVSNCKALWSMPHRGVMECITAVLYVALEASLYENVVYYLYCESFEKRYCDDSTGFAGSIITSAILSSAMSFFTLFAVYHTQPTIELIAVVLLFEFFITQASECPSEIFTDSGRKLAAFFRFLIYLSFDSSVVFFRNEQIVMHFPNNLLWYITIGFTGVIVLYYFNPSALNRGYSNQYYRLIEMYKDEYDNGELFVSRLKNNSLKKTKGLEDLVLALIISSAIIIGYYYAVKYGLIQNSIIQFFRSNGADILGTLISVTFLLTSFLSFLSSRDDICLWTDTMEYKLVSPKYRNFRSLTVYAFIALLAGVTSYFMEYDHLVASFFVIGILMLVILTFSMINVFFHRDGILSDLKNVFFSTSIKKQNDILRNLYFNSKVCIDKVDYKRIRENLSFLVGVSERYQQTRYDLEFYKSLFPDDESNTEERRRFKKNSKDMRKQYLDIPFVCQQIREIPQSNLSENKRLVGERIKEIDNNLRGITEEIQHQIQYISEVIIKDDIYLFIEILSDDTISVMSMAEIREDVLEHVRSLLDGSDSKPDYYEAANIIEESYGRLIDYLKSMIVEDNGIKKTIEWIDNKDSKFREEGIETLNDIKKELEGLKVCNQIPNNRFQDMLSKMIEGIDKSLSDSTMSNNQ
ncbi:hypothetical protein SAMN02910292_03111 [Lachnospiraceae bacterium XBB2008]|nr:hypothetical protein SAMN02910292_03111 [Lachnospiraceae bacterium XBB2008]